MAENQYTFHIIFKEKKVMLKQNRDRYYFKFILIPKKKKDLTKKETIMQKRPVSGKFVRDCQANFFCEE